MPGKKDKIKTSVYFIVPAPAEISPSQRFRYEQFLPMLESNGIPYHISNFYSRAGWKILYTRDNKMKKAGVVITGFFKRIADLFRLNSYSFIFVHREATPLGPPFFEWVIAKLLRKKIIYDFDDAIWVPAVSEYNRRAYWFKNFGKVARICRWSYKVSAGNNILAAYARKYNPNVVVVPTVVNTEMGHSHIQDHQTSMPAIGWTGTFSTLHYLDIVLPVLKELQQEYDFTFIVIADKDPQLLLRNYRFIKWDRDREVDDLLNFHIGLMPLYDDEISRGKCGFKAIQYMSLGIPALVSPVGVNKEIVDDGINGFICNKEAEWKERLIYLIKDMERRNEMGRAARVKIEENYSVHSARGLFLDLFDSIDHSSFVNPAIREV